MDFVRDLKQECLMNGCLFEEIGLKSREIPVNLRQDLFLWKGETFSSVDVSGNLLRQILSQCSLRANSYPGLQLIEEVNSKV